MRQEETDADARLMQARANYEVAAAEARKIELQAEAEYAKGLAAADRIRVETMLLASASNPLVAKLLKSKDANAVDAFDYLNQVIKQIEMHGGVVEFDIPQTEPENPETEEAS